MFEDIVNISAWIYILPILFLFIGIFLEKLVFKKKKTGVFDDSLFEKIIKNVPNPTAIFKPDGNIIYANEKFSSLTGTDFKKSKIAWTDIIAEDNLENLIQTTNRQFGNTSLTSDSYEIAINDKTGQRHYFLLNLGPLNETEYWIASFSDIKDRKIIEKELEQSKKYAELLLTIVPNPVYTVDNDLNILSWNKKACEITGFDNDDVIGKKFNFFFADHFKTDEFLKFSGKEILIISKGGILKHILLNINNISDFKGEKVGGIVSFEDITESKKREEILRKNEEQLTAVFSNMVVGFINLNRNGRYVYANKRWAEMLGVDTYDVYDLDFIESVYEEDKDKIENVLNDLIDSKIKDKNLDVRFLTDSGDIFWGSVSLSSVKGEKRIESIVGIVADVTAQKEHEIDIYRQKQFMEVLIDTIPIPLYYKDMEGRYLGCNRHFQNLFDMPKEEIVGKTSFKLIKEDVAERHHNMDKKIASSSDNEIHTLEMHYDNAPFKNIDSDKWHDIIFYKAAFKNFDGKNAGIIGTMVDVTDITRMEKSLKYKTDFENIILELSTEYVTLPSKLIDEGINKGLLKIADFIKADRVYIYLFDENGHKLNLTHIYSDETIPAEFRKNDTLDPTSFSEWFKRFTTSKPVKITDIEQLEGHRTEEKLILMSEGVKSLVVFPLIYEKGLSGIMGIESINFSSDWDDETLGLLQLAAEVFVNALNKKWKEDYLEKAKHDAESASKAKTNFLANMSHEIRTPLNGIIGMSKILLRSALSSNQKEYVKMIDISAVSLLDIINDILDISKIEADKIELEIADFNLREVINQVVSFFELRMSEKELNFNLKIKSSIPHMLKGDSLRLRQILINLLGNAIKFTDKGSVSLKIDIESLTSKECTLVFEVEDTGIGIEKESLDRIFENFTQSDISTTRKYGGTGLGLTITKRFIDMMKGDISVESEVGKGSIFRVSLTFPISDVYETNIKKSKLPQDEVPYIKLEDIPKMRHLIVEDNAVNRKYMEALFTHMKHEFVCVENGKKSIEKLSKDTKFDAIFMDENMPEMDGIAATKKIRELGINIPIIALTASALKGDKERFLNVGMNYYLPKPVDENLLLEILSDISKGKSSIISNKKNNKTVKHLIDKNEFLRYLSTDSLNTYVEMIDSFLSNNKDRKENIEHYSKEKDYKELKRLLHKIKGAVSVFFAYEVKDNIEKAENYLNTDNFDDFISIKDTIINQLEDLEIELEDIKKSITE